jgi:hypothetical protein
LDRLIQVGLINHSQSRIPDRFLDVIASAAGFLSDLFRCLGGERLLSERVVNEHQEAQADENQGHLLHVQDEEPLDFSRVETASSFHRRLPFSFAKNASRLASRVEATRVLNCPISLRGGQHQSRRRDLLCV